MARIAVKVLKILAAVVVVSGVLVASLAYAMTRHFNTPPPAVDYPKPANDLEAQRQDLTHFRKLMALDRSFEPAARAAAEARIAALEARQSSLDRAHFRVALMEILALADNGHTRLDLGDGAHAEQLPVKVFGFSDGIYVMRAMDTSTALLGGRVVAIGGKPIDVVMKRLTALRGGTTAWRRRNATQYLTDPELLFGADISPDAEDSVWTVVTSDDKTTTLTLHAVARGTHEPSVFADRWVSDSPLKGLDDRWVTLHPDRSLPVTLLDFSQPFRRVRRAQSCAMLIQLKANHDVGEERIKDFLAATETDMRSDKPCAAILDLRFDDGGNYQNTAAFAEHLPDLTQPGGPIYLLTGPATFSAGITTVGFVKQAGGKRVTILGEPVGDRLQFFSEGNRGCLPNSSLCVSY
jgi:hypothetical protein